MVHQATLWLVVICFVTQGYGDEGQRCIGPVPDVLDISRLFWSDHAYQKTEDPVKFNLCNGSATECEIKLKNGTVIGNKYVGLSRTNFSELMLTFSAGDNNDHTTFIYFSCDKSTLGKPVLLDGSTGMYYFEWKSSIACTGSVVTPEMKKPQMPCYVYSDDQGLIDLTELTNETSYRVQDGSFDMSINVCRNVTDVEGCEGAVCLQNGTAVGVVNRATKLEVNEHGVVLQYDKPGGGCGTIINFKCPVSPSFATKPTRVTPKSCEHTIDWYTTHACPAGNLSSTTCQLKNAHFQVDIDLTPLNNNNKVYTVAGISSEFSFDIAMCGTTIEDCDLKQSDSSRGKTVSCQRKPSEPTFHRTLGLSIDTKLKYVDDVLTMVMSKGDACSSGFQRVTIIYFHCNQFLGIGEPEFVSETDCSYVFDWHTRYACNQQQKCVYTDPNDSSKVYDFSSLIVPPESTSWTTVAGEGARAFINICQPVGGISGCDPTAAVCVKKTGQDSNKDAYEGSNNLGQASTMKFGSSDNMISLTYDHGSVCNTETKEQHQTVIYFACTTRDQSVGPQVRTESADTKCNHTFTWFTPAACTQHSSITNDCTVIVGGYTYDFNPLAQGDLAKDTYKFNPCKKLESGCGADATFCDGNKLISKTVPNLVVANDNLVTTTYQTEPGQHGATVRYICNHMAEIPVITKVDDSITVEVNTTLACAPKSIDCRPTDSEGNVYDFSGLKGTNWKAGSADGMTYYFSICSTLDKAQQEVKPCPGGAVSACQQTKDGTGYVNLGYAASNPQVISTGNIHFHYINGKVCGHGNKTPRQTKITLNCADVESDPRMREEDGDCNYEIWWDTPKACPVTASKTPSMNCTLVKEGIKYDLTSLKGKPFNTSYAGSNYYVGVCNNADVPQKPDSCKDSAVCVKGVSGDPYSTGNLQNYSLVSSGGKIELHYGNGKDGKQSIVTFLCSRKANSKPEMRFLSEDGTTFRFELTTTLVCPPLENVNCTRTFGNTTYDFSPLVIHDGNYLSHLYTGKLYYVNICHQLIATGDAANCPAGSTSCMYDSITGKYLSLGRLTSDKPDFISRLSSSFVYIQYDNGDVCPTNASQTLSTLILMRCVESDKQVVGAMEVGESIHDCRQNFILESHAACPKKDVPEEDQQCGKIDGFDTTPLKKQYVIESAEHKYVVNFCQSSSTTSGDVAACDGEGKFGVCQISKKDKKQVVAGKASLTAEHTDGRLIFNFTDGAKCLHDPDNSPRNVILTLFCNQYADADGEPAFVNEDPKDCTYYISWPRKDLCKQDYVPCTVSTGKSVIDLAQLRINPYYDYAIVNEDLDGIYRNKIYQISVCGSLPASDYNKCAGAGVCETTVGDKQPHKDIGFVDKPPQIVGTDKHVELVYTTQTVCSGQTDKKVSSVIKFSCGEGRGVPRLVAADGCTYDFTWETDAVCSEDGVVTPTVDCKFTRPTTKEVIDLSIFKNKVYKVENYAIQICSSLPQSDRGTCAPGSAVCMDNKKSAGQSRSMHMYEHSGDVILQYTGGEACRTDNADSGNMTTMIEFRCKQGVGEGIPEYQYSPIRCVNQFIWETSYVCVPNCELNYLGYLFDFRHLTSNIGPHTLSASGYDFSINLCKNLHTDNKCGNYTNICAQTSDGTNHAIAITSSLTARYVHENKAVELKYTSSNSSICSKTGLKPTVYVRLICSGNIGSPTFVSKEDCTFNFEWKTYVACQKADLTEVEFTNGLFIDPVSKNTFSIKYAWEQSVTVNSGAFSYDVSLSQPLEDIPRLSPNCTDGETRVCQYEDFNTLRRPIGKQILKYYYKDGLLLLVIGSDSKCGRVGSQTVTTVINLECNELSSNASIPTFVDEMVSCRYIFKWDLPQLCKPVDASGGGGGSGSPNKLSAGIVAVIVLVVIACIGTTVGIVAYKIRRKRQWDGTYDYSGLSSDNDATMLVSANKGGGPRFYDDDDDDILI